MAEKAGESIKITTVPNLRDLGGWPTGDGGRVRYGQLYRSTALYRLQGDEMAAFARLGVRSVYDLRTEGERTAQPDRVPEQTEIIVVDILADSSGAAPAQLQDVLSDPKVAEEAFGGDKAIALFEKTYRDFVNLPSARAGYRRLFSELTLSAHRPALFHCTTGKDRTGWAAAALLTLLGVPEELVMQDYLLTNMQLLPALQPIFDHFQAQGGDPKLLLPILGVREEYLAASLDEMRRRYGSIQGYFSNGLGLDDDLQRTLQTLLVER